MTSAERRFWQLAQRRVAALQPDVRSAILRAFQILRDRYSDAELARLIDSGGVSRVLDDAYSQAMVDRAFLGVRQPLRDAAETGFNATARSLPSAGRIDGVLAVAFDHLSPAVIQAIRDIDTKVIQGLKADVRETVRAYVENGLRDGVNPREIARGLRDVIGLGPTQAQFVENLRRELESGQIADAARRKLIDSRFNLDKLASLSESERAKRIDTIVEAYRKRYIAFNAETNARTATLDAYKAGQHATWQQAVENGVVDQGSLMKKWSGVLDSRERPEHVAMEGQIVPFDQPYSNGEMVPGESTYNCRCLSIVFVSAVAGAAA